MSSASASASSASSEEDDELEHVSTTIDPAEKRRRAVRALPQGAYAGGCAPVFVVAPLGQKKTKKYKCPPSLNGSSRTNKQTTPLALPPLLPPSSSALSTLCEANGITEEQLIDKADLIQHLEMFLFNFPRMTSLTFFTSLTSLSVMQQKITKLEGLEACPRLKTLWVVETKIKKIEGLDALGELTHLHLYSNDIERIEGLDALKSLQVLWLADNAISRVENLAPLTSLRELNLARNAVETVGDVLLANPSLTSVNLADNKIGSFKEIAALARLPNLRELCLADPHWGDNPVSTLCNYQTYVLFTIPGLAVLDTLPLAPETKALAEATYMKKKMYYNMRAKTLRRNATNAVRLAEEGRDALVGAVEYTLNLLARQVKEVEREMEEEERGIRPTGVAGIDGVRGGGALEALRSKRDGTKKAVSALIDEVTAIERAYEDCKSTVYDLGDMYVRRMMVELETGGNIRLEDGKPSDLWHSSCVDLVSSRFFASDYAGVSGLPKISGVRVTRVTRIHNRHLRNRFEQRLEALVDVSDPTYKRSLEYLFAGDVPELPGELQRCLEDGFRSPAEYDELGLDGAVVLSNSLSLADLPRLHASSNRSGNGNGNAAQGGGHSGGFTPSKGSSSVGIGPGWSRGQLLVAKVFLGKCTQEAGGSGTKSKPKIHADGYAGYNSVYRCKANDQKQRTWFAFEQSLVLPEYLVEFEYEYSGRDASTTGLGGESASARYSELTNSTLTERAKAELEKRTEFDVWQIARPIAPFLAAKAEAEDDSAGEKRVEAHKLLSLPPAVPPRTKCSIMSEQVLVGAAGGARASSITYLNLHGNALRRIEGLDACPNLNTLVLSFNEITKLEGLDGLTRLERLDLSYNMIKRIEGLKSLDGLRTLELNNNLLFRLEDLNTLKKYTPGLTSLNMRSNAVCENKSYKGLVLRRLTMLQSLDGSPVSEADRATAAESSSTLTPQMIRENAYLRRRTTWSLVSSRASGGAGNAFAGLMKALKTSGVKTPATQKENESPKDATAASGVKSELNDVADKKPSNAGLIEDDDGEWWCQVEEVVLERRRVRRLQNLERLTGMRRASFCDNEIARLEGLEECTALEELSLEENRIVVIEGLQRLTALKKLDLGKNRISRIENLSPHLVNLTQLSLEDNAISSLEGLAGLSSLMELYIGNNSVAELREVQQLKSLPKLIIMDLLGNPLCAQDDYRCYIIYHLRRIKVLDGMGVEAAEQAVAKNKYAGRLTRDFLEDKVGRRYFSHLRELDLCQMRVRDISGVFFASDFEQLEEINLDSNLVADPGGLCMLPKLTVLRMNGNRIEDRPMWSPQCLKAVLRARDAEQKAKEEAAKEAAANATEGNKAAAAAAAVAAAGATAAARAASIASNLDALEIAEGEEEDLLRWSPPFPSLEVLQLGANSIVSVSSLRLGALAKSLKVLFLQDNDISKLEGLDALCNLEELVLDRNRIKFLDPHSFEGLHSLRELRMEENGLRSLSHLSHLTRLHALHLTCNRVVDVAEVEKLVAHPELYELTLMSNPVTRKQVYRPMVLRHCPGLKFLDGKEVTTEERDHVDYLFSPVDAEAAAQAAAAQMQMNGAGGGNGGYMGMTGVGIVQPQSQSQRAASLGGLMGAAGLMGSAAQLQQQQVGGRMPVRMTTMNLETQVVTHQSAGGAGTKPAPPPSRERLAALQADLKAQAAATVAAQQGAGDRGSGRMNRFPGRTLGGR